MTFPLETWETFNVITPRTRGILEGDRIRGVVYGKPGDTFNDILERALHYGHCGLFDKTTASLGKV